MYATGGEVVEDRGADLDLRNLLIVLDRVRTKNHRFAHSYVPLVRFDIQRQTCLKFHPNDINWLAGRPTFYKMIADT